MTKPIRAADCIRFVRARWRAQDIIFHHSDGAMHTVGAFPNRRAKWSSLPYTLPDGRTGIWWQPLHAVRYKAYDFNLSRARDRLARVCRPNDEMTSTPTKGPKT